MKLTTIFGYFCLLYMPITLSYELPALNLGSTNILDGGPIRPKPGWYIFHYYQFNHAEKWMGHDGKELFCKETPKFNALSLSYQFAYQWGGPLLWKGDLGLMLSVPVLLYSQLEKNNVGIRNSDAGFGDASVGAYLQWNPIRRKNDDPLFVHRLAFNLGLPTGEYTTAPGKISAGSNFYFINPYWAATLYLTPRFTASWRLYYLWCFKNPTTKLKAGDAININYSLAYEIFSHCVLGINGYYLRQLENDAKRGIQIPHSKEQVSGIGAGAVYFFSHDLIAIGHIYYENAVKNRTKGMNFNMSLVQHF